MLKSTIASSSFSTRKTRRERTSVSRHWIETAYYNSRVPALRTVRLWRSRRTQAAMAARHQRLQEQRSTHRRSHRARIKHKTKSYANWGKKFLPVHMDEYAHQDVPQGTFILLEHTYNIPFVKYKCADHGMLEDDSLEELRFHYIQYLVHSWRLKSKVGQYYGAK